MADPPADGASRLDDADFPAYTIGRAADLLDVQPAFLRSLDATELLKPERSPGGQRRYSRAELALAARVRELLDQNMPLAAATRIVELEHQLARAQRRIAELEQPTGRPSFSRSFPRARAVAGRTGAPGAVTGAPAGTGDRAGRLRHRIG